ncbi:glycerate kinase [Thiosulfatimonas sediminis]|uniref:Glycerate kinase n=1 Tax=Thiosulfatimonas sediminis TaxID=2675054 RepID=A0A6F8PRZ8_9GAMM|nr:glycerate kinase [Thiosulfatimonas sediminis]BBP44903.1 glycerate kinase [Thiosulfatimonas sediminis]
MPRILIAPDSFKGSLTAVQFCQITEHLIQQLIPEAQVLRLPLSDGGEGFVDAFVTADLATRETVWVSGPLGKKVKAAFAWQAHSNTAMIEMAQASGLPKVRLDERNPLQTHTYGTGQVIQAALDKGAQKIVLGLGGSATNDGGVAALQALGVEVVDAERLPVGLGGQVLKSIARIDKIPEALNQVEWVLACDVTNPLLGANGATAIFGPQKGLQPQQFELLENGLANWAKVIQQRTGKTVANLSGAGAAGGMAAGFMGILNAQIQPGFEVLREQLQLDAAMQPKDGVPLDWVITGEGRIDEQTAFGKLPMRIAQMAQANHVPCIGICGSLGASLQDLPAFNGLFSIVNAPMAEMDAMRDAPQLLESLLRNLLPLLKMH